eukprot:1195182-Prorocentrum_minimum.AAC.3
MAGLLSVSSPSLRWLSYGTAWGGGIVQWKCQRANIVFAPFACADGGRDDALGHGVLGVCKQEDVCYGILTPVKATALSNCREYFSTNILWYPNKDAERRQSASPTWGLPPLVVSSPTPESEGTYNQSSQSLHRVPNDKAPEAERLLS